MTKNLEKLANQPFRTITYFEPEDNSWYAYHPELGEASCYAIGETEEEARELLKEETRDFIQLLLSEGKEVPTPQTAIEEELPSGQFITRIPRTLHKKLKERAEYERVSLNHLVSVLLAQSLEQRDIKSMFTKTFEQIMMDEHNVETNSDSTNPSDNDDLDIPTIFRVKGAKLKVKKVYDPEKDIYSRK